MTDVVKTTPPHTGPVTEVHKKEAEANVLNQAEAPKQVAKQAHTEAKAPVDPDPNYDFKLSYATHELEVKPEQGATYNYHGVCSCAWEERHLTKDQAEAGAYRHIDAHFPGVTPRRG